MKFYETSLVNVIKPAYSELLQ